MSIKKKGTNMYKTSKDYERLWELARAGERKECSKANIEFIEPGPKVSAKALDALDKAIEYFNKLCVPPAIVDPRRVGQLEKLLKENEAIRDGLKEIKAALELKKEKESEET